MKKIKTMLLVLVAVMLMCTACSSGVTQEEYDAVVAERDDYKQKYEELITKQELKEQEAEEQVEFNDLPEESETETTTVEDLGLETYDEGQYKVGADIPSGEYIVISYDGIEGYFSVTSDANGDNILFNDNFLTNSIITIKDGEFLRLSGCMATPFDKFYESGRTIDLSNYGIMIKIGNEIQPGEYKVVGEDGYWCIYPDSRHEEIISNELISGSGYVNVSDGQYLVLKDCVIENN